MRNIIIEDGNIQIDEGTLFGQGVFETICVLNGKVIFLEEHLERLNDGIAKLNLGEKISENHLKGYIDQIKSKNIALKVIVTPKNIILKTRDIPYCNEDYIRGFNLKLSSVLRNSTSMLTYIKSTCYIENLLENKKAKKEGFDEVIFLNEKGFITEGSTSNIFIVKNGEIVTPSIKSGLLPGVLRRWVISNFKVKEERITLSDFREADEAFITNSLIGIMKVKSYENIEYNNFKTSDKIREKYLEYIGSFGGKSDGR